VSEFSDELRRLMAERGVGVRELARQVPCNPGYVSNLRNGRKKASRQVAARLDLVLDAGGKLVALASAAEARTGRASELGQIDKWAAQAVEFGRWTEASNVGTGTIDQLDEEIHRLARESVDSALEPLLHRAGGVSRSVFRLLRQHQRLWQTRDLYVIGAKSSAFLACVCGDLGQQSAAAAHARTALILAQESGHPGALALALSALSKVAFWDRQLSRASDLARRGYECCPPNSTRVLLACQEADAADVSAARESISRAVYAEDEIAADDDLGGLFSCTRTRRAAYTITLHLRSGEPEQALRAAAEADVAYCPGDGTSYGTWGQVQISAALAHLTRGDADAARERLSPVLALPAGMRLATFNGKLEQTIALLAGPLLRGSSSARDLAEQVGGYLQQRHADGLPYPVGLSVGSLPR